MYNFYNRYFYYINSPGKLNRVLIILHLPSSMTASSVYVSRYAVLRAAVGVQTKWSDRTAAAAAATAISDGWRRRRRNDPEDIIVFGGTLLPQSSAAAAAAFEPEMCDQGKTFRIATGCRGAGNQYCN